MADRTDTHTFPDGRVLEVDVTEGDPPTFKYRLDGKAIKDQAQIAELTAEARNTNFAGPASDEGPSTEP
jgi:hypothetical protein